MSVQAGPPPGASGAYTRTGNPDDAPPSGPEPLGAGRQRSGGPARGGRSPWLLRNWRLRNKLIVVLVVPLVLAGVLGGLRIGSTTQTASDLGAVVTRLGLAQQVSGLLDRLQTERTLATTYVATGRGPGRDQLQAQFDAVDEAAAPLLATAPADFGTGAENVANAALVRLRGVQQIRKAMADPGAKYQTDAVLTTYTDVINSLLALSRATLTVQDAQLTQEAADLTLIGQAKEQVALQHAALLSAAATNPHRASAIEESLARSAAAQFDSIVAQFRASGQPATQQLYAATVSGPDVDNRERIETQALTAFTLNRPVATSLGELNDADNGTAELVRRVETQLEGQLSADASALSAQASRDSTLNILAVVLAVVLTVLVLVLVARSMIRPLRTLRAAAFDVAQRRLPQAIERLQDAGGEGDHAAVEPIGIDTDEEIGEVARAFDAVHAEAIRLAGEQALLRANVNDIFVNLSRRSQGLVKRQLGLIDKLESDEQDPDHLGDLFQLDHLATRMRRNNENLLVLAGAAELRPRRRRPVPTEDVLRAAVSEVEDYQRVVVRRAPSVSVAGPAVNDLVHLMAELLDNATTFSPPDSTVVLSSTLDAGNGLVIEISDSGVGIEPPTLRAINAELADPPTVDAAVSRRMGLFVVGRLAQRNNIHVQLQAAPVGQGTIAVVTVPAMLLMTAAQAAAAEMATSEFPASNGSSTGSWAVPEQGVPAPRTPARPAEPSYAWPAEPAGPPPSPARGVPAPRQPQDPGVGGWGEFEIGGPPPQRQPMARRPEWTPPGQGGPQTGPHTGPQPGPRTGPHTGPQSRFPAGPRSGPPAPPAPPSLPRSAQLPPAPAPQIPQQTSQPISQPVSQPDRPAEPPVASDLFHPVASGDGATPDESPIYDEVRTSWFRMDQLSGTGSTPAVGAASGGGAHSAAEAPDDGDPGSSDQASTWSGGAHRPAEEPDGRDAERSPAAEPERAHQDDRPVPASAPARPAPNGNGGGSAIFEPAAEEIPASEWGPIENGWRAAREFTELTREFLTEAGLPKRRAGSRPLPGSFGENPPSGGAAVRNPDAVRGRLREYQRGLRHGRYAQTDVAEPSASSTGGQE